MSTWSLLKSDNVIFYDYVKQVDVEGIEFHDVLDLDNLEIMHCLHGGIYGFIYTFKWNKNLQLAELFTKLDPTEFITFIKQMENNSCGTIALMNFLFNLKDKDIVLGDFINGIISFCHSFDSTMLGEAISSNDRIRTIHNEYSNIGDYLISIDQSESGNGESDIFHHVCIMPVRVNDKVFVCLMDGLLDQPLLVGSFNIGTDDSIYNSKWYHHAIEAIKMIVLRIQSIDSEKNNTMIKSSLICAVKNSVMYYNSEIERKRSLLSDLIKDAHEKKYHSNHSKTQSEVKKILNQINSLKTNLEDARNREKGWIEEAKLKKMDSFIVYMTILKRLAKKGVLRKAYDSIVNLN